MIYLFGVMKKIRHNKVNSVNKLLIIYKIYNTILNKINRTIEKYLNL
jgi:hypothetical protein